VVKRKNDILGLRLSNKDHAEIKRMVRKFLASDSPAVKKGDFDKAMEIMQFLKQYDQE
jgi:hypothetical protein